MKTIILLLALQSSVFAQPPSSVKPATKPVGLPVIPAAQVTREKAWEYLTLTQRAPAMEKTYKARFIDVKGAFPISEEMRKKHLDALNNMLIKLVQKSFSPASLDAVLTFLKTPAGERWAEDAATFNEEFRDESMELLNEFSEEINEAKEAATDTAPATVAPAKPGPPAAHPQKTGR